MVARRVPVVAPSVLGHACTQSPTFAAMISGRYRGTPDSRSMRSKTLEDRLFQSDVFAALAIDLPQDLQACRS